MEELTFSVKVKIGNKETTYEVDAMPTIKVAEETANKIGKIIKKITPKVSVTSKETK